MATSTGSRKRSAQYDVTRERIIDKAAELFARNGYAATGVADLGAAIPLERGALYYYIGSKEELLADIHERVMEPLLRRVIEIASGVFGFIVRLSFTA